ncbi:hypothetical protein [Streptomyces rimosus]|uniref:hypothetical protein n=1 Tax=Streptomyces rimosus TaxID=1927 RepID=UPI0004BEBDA7|nr:hypothetical protein [Streptomyces rimosus]
MPVPGADVAPGQWHPVAPLVVAAAGLTVLLGGCLGSGAVPGCWVLAPLMLGWVRDCGRSVRD